LPIGYSAHVHICKHAQKTFGIIFPFLAKEKCMRILVVITW
jgi:hypothetical protein